MDTGFGRTRETKTLGPTMLFSVIPKRTLAFSPQNQPLHCRILIAGTEYDLEAIYKKREIRERVRLGPSTGIVEEAVSRILGSD
jgi:cyanophycin synthetase